MDFNNLIGKKIFNFRGNKKEIVFMAKENKYIFLIEGGEWIDLRRGLGNGIQGKMVEFEDRELAEQVYKDKILRFLWTDIENFEFSVRCYNSLKRSSINMLNEFFYRKERRKDAFFGDMKWFMGKKSIDEIMEMAQEFDISINEIYSDRIE